MEYLYSELSNQIIGAAVRVHKALGPGLLENVYKKCLEYELRVLGLDVKTEVAVPLKYKSMSFDCTYRLDLIVEDLIILELKAISETTKLHKAQLTTYLRLMDKKLGLLFNFNNNILTNGIVRVINSKDGLEYSRL